MKKLFIKKLLFLLIISLNAFGQDGKFTFTLSSAVNTSAGVFKNDSILVRTLWNNVNYSPGTYTKYWDGKDDYGNNIASPDPTYKIKVLSNNVQYAWQGTIGNTSDFMSGVAKHRGYYHCMRGVAFGSTYGYFATGYVEGTPSIGKFLISKPNQKIHILSPTDWSSNADNNYVATDDINVYWGASDGTANSNTFVYATKVSNDAEVNFSAGVGYSPLYGRAYNTISKVNQSNSIISGLAVQKAGNYLFVARSGLNQLQVLNKTTGVLIQTLSYSNPRGLSVDGSDNLWMASGTNTVAKYIVNTNGTLTLPIVTLSGLVDPLATQVSADGSLITVADGSTSQQVKFYNNNTGVAGNTLGIAGGYTLDATVNDNKFYFSDVNGSGINQYNKLAFVAFQPDGSFWVGDPGNFRVQHYNSSSVYVDRIMSMGSNYNTFADKNNISKVFSEFLEFDIDYSVQTLTGTTGWKLKKNWGSTISTTTYNGSPRFETTLSNGRTYGLLHRKGLYKYEIVEFPSNGQIRFTGVLTNDLSAILCSDGSLQYSTEVGLTNTVIRYPLTGFNSSNNPTWSSIPDILAVGIENKSIGNPVVTPTNQIFTTTGKVVFYNPKALSNDVGSVFSSGYHLGLMQKGANNSFLFQTEQSTQRNYQGPYPQPGWFDVGNTVNDYAGGNVNIVDRNIITSYHGEFWKNGQTNKFNHYYDNGLAIGQFGITRPEVTGPAAAMMAGNALSPIVVKDGNGDMYLYHGDESDHSGFHRWKITGLNTIAEQVIPIPFPSAYGAPIYNYINLMVGLPFSAELVNNTAGWTRNPAVNNESNPFNVLWRVNTSSQSYQKLTSNDVTVEFLSPGAATNNVSRDLGTNNVTKEWKISGEVIFPSDNNVNGLVAQQFLEVLDANGKILTSFYVAAARNTTTIYGNSANIASSSGSTIQLAIQKLLPFEMGILNGTATFTYGNYPAVSTTISDATGNWKTPKTLRIRILNNGAMGPANKQTIGIKDFKFYKDYSITGPINQPPVAIAGTDKIITLPTNSTTLTGSGADADGTIKTYAWIQLSGPSSGTIVTVNAAATLINNLLKGIYQYELTVTDNNGATGKDTVQVTVNPIGNKPPVANAGIDKTITLPINSVTLTGSGTDVDGTVNGYGWIKISGPSSGTIVTANAASTSINGLVQGLYEYELTVTDNNSATGKDTIQINVNAAINQLPVASAGADIQITLPVNSITLTGNGIDTDGTISSYGWLEISGPSTGSITTAYAASTQVNNLIQGVYQYELTVTDNNGAIGKDTLQVTVNAAIIVIGNKPPVANAGLDQVITLPINSITLTGTGTDTDGTINSYGWAEISGPSTGTIETTYTATTSINSLLQGVYQYELTVIDNNGATGKDTINVTVNAAPIVNQPPVANPGSDQVITLPTNSITLTGSGIDADGTINSYGWTEISGPSSGTIVTANAATTSINNLLQGVYQYQLTVTDNNGAIGKAIVQVTVNAAVIVNQPPVADAGTDKIITLPTNSITLTGNGTDADGTIKSYGWTEISGPSTGTIGTANTASTSISNLAQGVYEYELTVTDNKGAIGKDTVQVTVNPIATVTSNQPPVSNAGIDKVITLPANSVTLTGSGTDADGTINSYGWIEISGPSTGTIATANGATTIINNLVQGIYEYELTVTDNSGATDRDTVQVTVNAIANITGNQPPVANAGLDKVITLPANSVTLTGSGTDGDGTINSYGWIKISGPVSGTIATANGATTIINNLVQGIYEYELTVTDNSGATDRDTVQVTVNAIANITGNQPPVANAGLDKVITLPANSVTLTGSGTDADGIINSYGWIKISGPASGTIATANGATTSVNNLVQGVYEYELMVTDNNGATAKDTVQVTVNAAVIVNQSNQPPTANAGADINVVLPLNTVLLTGSGIDSDGRIVSYDWKVINGPTGSLIVSPTMNQTKIGNLFQGVYNIELSVADNNGAIAKDTITITVSSPRLSNYSSNEFKVYPNPTSDIANLNITTINGNTKMFLSVIDLNGKVVKYEEHVTSINNTLLKIDMSNLSNGNYIISVIFDDGRKLSAKVLKYGGK